MRAKAEHLAGIVTSSNDAIISIGLDLVVLRGTAVPLSYSVPPNLKLSAAPWRSRSAAGRYAMARAMSRPFPPFIVASASISAPRWRIARARRDCGLASLLPGWD
jgi:hypothetical protein